MNKEAIKEIEIEIAEYKSDLVGYIADGDVKSIIDVKFLIEDAEGMLACEKGFF